jgi:superfamily II DNA helicase RecQ
MIVYAMLQRDADDVAMLLIQHGYDAQAYHAGKDSAERARVQVSLTASLCLQSTRVPRSTYPRSTSSTPEVPRHCRSAPVPFRMRGTAVAHYSHRCAVGMHTRRSTAASGCNGRVQAAFIGNKLRIVVATIAFAMGKSIEHGDYS